MGAYALAKVPVISRRCIRAAPNTSTDGVTVSAAEDWQRNLPRAAEVSGSYMSGTAVYNQRSIPQSQQNRAHADYEYECSHVAITSKSYRRSATRNSGNAFLRKNALAKADLGARNSGSKIRLVRDRLQDRPGAQRTSAGAERMRRLPTRRSQGPKDAKDGKDGKDGRTARILRTVRAPVTAKIAKGGGTDSGCRRQIRRQRCEARSRLPTRGAKRPTSTARAPSRSGPARKETPRRAPLRRSAAGQRADVDRKMHQADLGRRYLIAGLLVCYRSSPPCWWFASSWI